MSDIVFTPFENENQDLWSKFVDDCDCAWLHHTPAMMRLSHIERGGVNCCFLIRHGSDLVSICVFSKYRSGLGSILSGPGIAILKDIHTRKTIDLIEVEINRIAGIYSCQAVRFFLSPLAPELKALRYHDSLLAELGFSFGVRGNSLDYEAAYCSVVKLKSELKNILDDFTKGNRASVLRCRKMGITCSVFRGGSLSEPVWRDFIAIHKATFARNGLTPFSAARLECLAELVRSGYMGLVTAYEDDRPIASILLETYKDGVNYLAGGCTGEGLRIGVMAFTHFSAMEWAKLAGFSDYCVGTTGPMERGTKNGAIGASKKRFGGEKWDYLAGELVLDRRAYTRKILIPAALAIAGLRPRGLGSVARWLRDIGKRRSVSPKSSQEE